MTPVDVAARVFKMGREDKSMDTKPLNVARSRPARRSAWPVLAEKEQRRLTILAAAERIVAKRGWADTNFGEIAGATRLSRSLIYVYFPTKDDLLAALVDRANKSLSKRFQQAIAEAKNGNDAVVRIGAAFHQFSKEETFSFELISQFDIMHSGNEDEPGKGPAQAFQDCLEILSESLKRGIQDGTVSKTIGDPKFAAFSLYAYIHGLIRVASVRPKMMQALYRKSPDEAFADGMRILNRATAAKKNE